VFILRTFLQRTRGKGIPSAGLVIFILLLAGSCASRKPLEIRDEVLPQQELPRQGLPQRGLSGEVFSSEAAPPSEPVPEPSPEISPEPVPPFEPTPPPGPDFLTLIAAGDNLFQDVMIRPPPENETYHFESIYSLIKPYIEPADIAFINQETLLAGKAFGFSGYPRFNTPQELGDALVSTGFDVVNHATNHIMDKGEKAVFATMDYWDAHPEIAYLGIHKSPEQRNRQVIIEKNHIKVGFLAYTMETNGLPVPGDKPYLVSLGNTAVMAEEIDRLRPNCDFLVVSMHWGVEYEYTPNAVQERMSKFLAEHKVDLVIGHHPHVIQPFAAIPRPDGGVMFCFYSLGNFVSAQIRSSTLLGGLMYLKIKKTELTVTVENAGIIPVITHYEKGFTGFKIYPLKDYTEELAKIHGTRQLGNAITLSAFKSLVQSIFDSALIEGNPFIHEEKTPPARITFKGSSETNLP
jgi:poly-gamma-glutamate synthesis protein (capsule biosynthesis protein)